MEKLKHPVVILAIILFFGIIASTPVKAGTKVKTETDKNGTIIKITGSGRAFHWQ